MTFDLWETLLIDQPELDLTRGRSRCTGLLGVLSGLGIELSIHDIQRGYEETAPRFQSIWSSKRHLDVTEQIRMILETASAARVSLPQDPRAIEMLQTAYVEPIFCFPPRLNEDAVPTLEGMLGRVKKVGLISNTGRSPGIALRQLMNRCGILKFFDATVFSDEIGWRKPDRRIFEVAANELQTDMAKVIHIGDDPEADIWGAKQAGMRALLFDYEVPKGFRRRRSSLFSLARADRHIPDSEIRPDGRINSLREALAFIDSVA